MAADITSRRPGGAAPWLVTCALCALALSATGTPAQATAADDFRQSCFSCHTIGGGRLTGPDLKDLAQRRDRPWLTRFIANPKAVIDSGDSYAQALFNRARGVVMPTVAGMTEARAATLLDLIEAESKLPESQFKGIANLNRPFTRQELALGAELFDGRRPLANGAPACISCHTVPAVGGLGGGRLGPDLSGVYANVQGPTALAGWLSAPPSPTMQPVFTAQRRLKSEEVIALVAFIDQAARSARPAGTAGTVVFLMLALLGAVAALMALDAVWRRRFHAVRRTLVEQTADAFNTRKRGRS